MPKTIRLEVPRAFRPLLEPSRYKGAHGGRGSAKSHFFAGYLLVRCLERPIRAVCVREVQRSLEQSVKRLLEDKIEALEVGDQFRVLNTHIETPGGGIIIFQGMQNHTSQSIKSLEGYDIAWVEEAQAVSQRSLDLLRPTIRKPGSELWFSWNPEKESDPVDAFLRADPPPPNSIVIQSNWEDNPWFSGELREEMEWDRQNDPVKFSWVWGGKYLKRSSALVFTSWRVEDFETPDDARFYFGADWGYSVDPAALVRCWIDGRTLYVDYEAYKVGCEIDYLPFLFGGCQDQELQAANEAAWKVMPQQYKGWQGVPGSRKWTVIADSSKPDTISYMKRHGFQRMEPSTKGAGSVDEGVQFLQSYEIVVHPRCKHTIDELNTYSYKIDRKTDEVLPMLEDKKNHVIDSLRYAVEKIRRSKKNRATW